MSESKCYWLVFNIGPGVLASATHGGGRSEAGHCFHLFYFFFFSAFYFSPTSGNLPFVKVCFPQYFGLTRRYMQKKIFLLGNFYFFTKKADFGACFRNGQRSVTEPGPTPSPWSIIIIFMLRLTPHKIDPARLKSLDICRFHLVRLKYRKI